MKKMMKKMMKKLMKKLVKDLLYMMFITTILGRKVLSYAIQTILKLYYKSYKP